MTSRFPRPLSPLPALLASLALVSAGAHAQQQTARLVKDANRAPGNFNANISWVMPIGNNVVFPKDTLAQGSELWISDGTAKGTRLLKDLMPGPGGTFPEDPQAFGDPWGGILRQVAFRDAEGNKVWVTDGTSAGTQQIFTSPTPGSSEVRLQAGTWHGLFFENIDGSAQDSAELFFSEGTAERTWSLNPIGEEGRRFSNPYGYLTGGPTCLFIANGNEIWETNGYGTTKRVTATAGTPERLASTSAGLFVEVGITFQTSELWLSPGQGQISRVDMPEGAPEARLEHMSEFASDLWFIRYDVSGQRELWTSDGTTAGTRKITLLNGGQGPESHAFGPIRPWKDALYLAARNDNGDEELWRTDGTSAGTRRIASFTPPETNLVFYGTPDTEDFLYFETSAPGGAHQLWRTKGDAASTRPVKGTPAIAPPAEWPQIAATQSGGIFFAADPLKPEMALWRLRGKTNGAVRLTKPEKSTGSGTAQAPVNSQSHEMLDGDLLSFVDTGSGHELWRMKPDGTGARSLWKAASPLSYYGTLGFHAVTPHGAIFSYFDGADVRQVWVTDGTTKGTRLLGDHGTANHGGYPSDFVKLGDTWYYSVVNSEVVSGASLWRTDGTPAGTTKVVASGGTAPGPVANEIVVFNNLLYFFAIDTDFKTGLWRSDGTPAGTVMLMNEWHGATGEMPTSLSVAGGELVLAVRTPWADSLWHSDGTAAGTDQVNYAGGFSWSISPAVDLNGAAIFQGDRNSYPGLHWHRHDATGTHTLRTEMTGQQMYPWYPGSRRQAVAGTQLFYSGLYEGDAELWVTDGTNLGTTWVKDINPGPESSYPDEMLAVGDVIYFTAYDETHGNELWRSDGTEAGTVLVADIEPGPESSIPKGLKVMNGKLYFNAQRRDVGRELFVIDLPVE